jgi:hypothetical protein
VTRSSLLFLVPAAALAGSAAAQEKPAAVMERAKAKFEADMAKLDVTLLVGLDKAIAAKTTDKATVQKLTYEREVFVKSRIVPATFPGGATYARGRNAATTALEAAYLSAARELSRSKKADEAAAAEDALGELLKAARGYGIAVPDLEAKPVFVVESKAFPGQVIDTAEKGSGALVLGAKVGRRKPTQCWQLEREDGGYVVRNLGSGYAFHVPAGSKTAGTGLVVWSSDKAKETSPSSLFRLDEVRRDVAFGSAFNGLVLTATERKEKGVTTVAVTQEKKEKAPPPAQLWTLVEAK